MARIRVIYDPQGETLTVYWREPSPDQVCEETGEGIILIKDRQTGEASALSAYTSAPATERRRRPSARLRSKPSPRANH